MNVLKIAIFFLAVSCASSQKPIPKTQTKMKPVESVESSQKKKITLPKQKVVVPIGQAKFISYPLPATLAAKKITCDLVGNINFEQIGEELSFFMPIPYKLTAKEIECQLRLKKHKGKFNFLSISVQQVDYPTKQLNVAKKHVELSDEAIQRWLKEKAKQEEIYATPHATVQFKTPFIRPLKSKITSQFGYKRVFNNKKDSWHSGTDMRAAIGTKIPAANRGIVRFAGELYFNGGTIILDHGMGIYTMYCHLSKVMVQEGEIVPQGAIIGKSGNTGRSTGPHLHWATKVNGHWVNSLSMIEESKLYSQIKK